MYKIIILVIVFILGKYSISLSGSYFGAFYQQSNANLFTVGTLQYKPGEKLPVDLFTQLGYSHDRRFRENYKGYGNGVNLEFVIAPYLELNIFKAGIFGSVFGLLEAYKRTDLNAYWRERDAGYSTGLYGAFNNTCFLRLGVFKAFELSKFLFSSYSYPLGFCFNVSAAFQFK
jgi:hypothetical protein